jgi:hypothetical protein
VGRIFVTRYYYLIISNLRTAFTDRISSERA